MTSHGANRILKLLVMLTVAAGALVGPGAAGALACPLVGTCEPEPAEPAPTQPEPAPQPQPAPAPDSQPKPVGEDKPGAAKLVSLVNGERAKAGARALSVRGDVAEIALGHSWDMSRRGTIWHNDAYFTSATHERLGASALGENVALNSTVEGAHDRLMASEGHRHNILDPRFTHVGMAVVRDSQGRLFVTQNFMTARTAAPAPAPKPATVKSSGAAPKPVAPKPLAPKPPVAVEPAPAPAPQAQAVLAAATTGAEVEELTLAASSDGEPVDTTVPFPVSAQMLGLVCLALAAVGGGAVSVATRRVARLS